jgi:hypothetical protein
MSNSVVFLLIAVGLSAVGTLLVWLHGRPRRPRSSVDHFSRSLRALSHNDTKHEAPSGVVIRPGGVNTIDDEVVEHEVVVDDIVEPDEVEAPAARAPRPSPRPTPRHRPERGGSEGPASERPTSEGTRPGS